MADQNPNDQQSLTPEKLLDMARKKELPVEYTDTFPTTLTPENFQAFARGQITWGELIGTTLEEAYAIAGMGYTLFEQGRFKEAQVLYEGLTMSNPGDPYFHTMLGAIYAKQELSEQAIEEYTVAIAQDPKNVSAFVNRGELLLKQGKIQEALADLKSAIQSDPKSENPSSIRARALAAATAAVVQDKLSGGKADPPKK